MKKDTHPEYQDVLFIDSSTGTKFLIGSTIKSKETETFEGKEYPVYRVAVSSASHPFFTGSKQFIDTEGRVDKFRKRYAQKKEAAVKEVEKKAEKPAPAKKKRATKTTKAKAK